MSTSTSATSTELIPPERFGGKSLFSNKSNNLVVIISTLLIGLMMWSFSPGIGILALSFVAIYAVSGLSLNYQAGVTGIINIGVVGFFAIGAYSVSILTLLGWNWFGSLVIGILITSIITYLISKAIINLREDYFAIITITLGEIIRFIFQKEGWIVYPPSQAAYWGGTKGLSPGNAMIKGLTIIAGFNIAEFLVTTFASIRTFLLSLGVPASITVHLGVPNWYLINLQFKIADMFNINFTDASNLIFLIAMTVILLICFVVFERIYNSPLGRLNKAIREDALATETLGENIANRQVNVMVLGNVLIAIGGGFFAYFLASISPESFLPVFTFYVWAVVVLGGISNNRGILFGALIFGTSIPFFATIQLKDKIQGLFGAFMKPFIPSVLGIFAPGVDNFILFGIVVLILILLYLVVYFNIIKVKNHNEEKFDFNYSYKELQGFALAFIILAVGSIPLAILLPLHAEEQLTLMIILLLFALYYVVLVLKYRNSQKSLESRKISVVNWFLNTFYIDKNRVINILLILLGVTVIPELFDNLPILPKPNFDSFLNVQGVTFVPVSTFFTGLDPEYARIMVVGIVIMVFILFKPEGVLKERQIKTVDSLQEYAQYYNTNLKISETELNIPKGQLPPGAENYDLLSGKGLTKNFGGVVGLDKVSFTVKRGQLLGVIGPNGSGKSTFFNVLTGLLEQDKNEEGKIEFLGRDITYSSISERARLGIGRTFQQSRLFRNLTVLENVLISAKEQQGVNLISALTGNWKHQESELHQQAFQILQYLNILHIWNNRASDISGGQQKLVALARALMSKSHIILLDEPVAGVNPTLAKKIFEKIQNLHQNEGQNYVIIEHNMDVQLNFCDYIYVFNKGQIAAEGSPDEIKNNESVLDAYLGH